MQWESHWGARRDTNKPTAEYPVVGLLPSELKIWVCEVSSNKREGFECCLFLYTKLQFIRSLSLWMRMSSVNSPVPKLQWHSILQDVIERNRLPHLNPDKVLLLDLFVTNRILITSTSTWCQVTFGQRLMIYFVIISLNLCCYVLYTVWLVSHWRRGDVGLGCSCGLSKQQADTEWPNGQRLHWWARKIFGWEKKLERILRKTHSGA